MMSSMAANDGPLAVALARLERLREACGEILAATHYVTGKDGVVLHPETGRPVEDYGPKQRAITEMRHLDEQMLRLLGVFPRQRVEVVTGETVDREIAKSAQELEGGD